MSNINSSYRILDLLNSLSNVVINIFSRIESRLYLLEMLSSTRTNLRSNGLHNTNRHVVNRMCPRIDDKRESTLHGRLTDRSINRNNKSAWNPQQIIGRIDESRIRYEGIH